MLNNPTQMPEPTMNWPKLLALTIDDIMFWNDHFTSIGLIGAKQACTHKRAVSWLSAAAGIENEELDRVLRGFKQVNKGSELETGLIMMAACFTPVRVCRACGLSEAQIEWGSDMALGINREPVA